MSRLNLGCGNEIFPGYINVDSAALPGIDVVCDLSTMPWPFKDGEAEEIVLKHVLEHLPNTIKVMEELSRISRPGALIRIFVPYWNGSDAVTDSTHIRMFNERSFDFFDPRHPQCQKRSYYSTARFHIRRMHFQTRIFGKYVVLRWFPFRFIAKTLAHFLCNIIQVMEVDLEVIK